MFFAQMNDRHNSAAALSAAMDADEREAFARNVKADDRHVAFTVATTVTDRAKHRN